MTTWLPCSRLRTVALAAATAATLMTTMSFGDTAKEKDTVRSVIAQALPNIPGQKLTALVVNYAPGGSTAGHRHAGSVFAYVLSGQIRSENSATGPARVYKAGESFFEPPGSVHRVSANASATEPASLLAVIIAEEGAELTTMEK